MYLWMLLGFDCKTVSGHTDEGAFHAWNSIKYIDENGRLVEVSADATFASSVGVKDKNKFISPSVSLINNDYER